MARHKKTGPKPKPAAQKRTARIMLNLTPVERRELEARAGMQPLAAFVRDKALAS
jgi:hypothetical protein